MEYKIMIILSIIVLILIIAVIYTSLAFKKENDKALIDLADIDESISKIETIEDCCKVIDRIYEIYNNLSSTFNNTSNQYLARYHMVKGIKYILIKQDKKVKVLSIY